jgi:hypothetical protein
LLDEIKSTLAGSKDKLNAPRGLFNLSAYDCSLPQHQPISVSSFLTRSIIALTPSLRPTYVFKYVNWLHFTAPIVLHRICGATAQGQQRHLLRREMYWLAVAVIELSVITSVLQLPY